MQKLQKLVTFLTRNSSSPAAQVSVQSGIICDNNNLHEEAQWRVVRKHLHQRRNELELEQSSPAGIYSTLNRRSTLSFAYVVMNLINSTVRVVATNCILNVSEPKVILVSFDDKNSLWTSRWPRRVFWSKNMIRDLNLMDFRKIFEIQPHICSTVLAESTLGWWAPQKLLSFLMMMTRRCQEDRSDWRMGPNFLGGGSRNVVRNHASDNYLNIGLLLDCSGCKRTLALEMIRTSHQKSCVGLSTLLMISVLRKKLLLEERMSGLKTAREARSS